MRLTLAVVAMGLAVPVMAAANPVEILFVGNSFTHGRYNPVRGYNGGFGTDAGNVHDLLCPTAGSCSAEPGPQIDPATSPPSGFPSTLSGQLSYLTANPGAQYNEPGPDGGVPGVFLQFTKEAGLSYDVSILAVSSATLAGYTTGTSKAYFSSIASSKWDHVVLQDQSFEPLPSTITVGGKSVSTRGNFTRFETGVDQIVGGIDAADQSAGKAAAKITLYETQPLASYGYTSSNPNQPIYGSSTSPPGGLNAPYVGDANPITAMASDLHNAYEQAAKDEEKGNPEGSAVDVALAGDAWVTAINDGTAMRDPYLLTEPAGQVDLWDNNPLDACCTTPVGYHPSTYGAYLDALVLFEQITGVNPETLTAEFDASDTGSASSALGIDPAVAQELAVAAAETVRADRPIPEPGSLALLGAGVVALGALGWRRSGHDRATTGIATSQRKNASRQDRGA